MNKTLNNISLITLSVVLISSFSIALAATDSTSTTDVTTDSSSANTSSSAAATTAVDTTDNSVAIDTTLDAKGKAGLADFKKALKDVDKLAKLKIAGAGYIDSRVALLQAILTAIKNSNGLDATIKASLTTDVQKQIDDLTALKTKISAETELATLKTDVKNIFAAHHIYAVFAPESRGLFAVGRLEFAAANLTALETKIDSFLVKLKDNGTDTTTGDSAFADYKTQLAAATTALDSAKASLGKISLTDVTGAKKLLSDAQTQIKAARSAIDKARTDLETIIALDKSATGTSADSTTTVTK